MADPPEGITIRQGDFGMAPSPGSQFPVSFPDQDYVLVADPESSYFKFSLTMDQALFTWGKVAAGVEAARLELSALKAERRQALLDLDRDLALAYFGASLSRESLVLLDEGETLLQEAADDAEKVYQSGSSTRKDWLEVRATVAKIAYQKARAREGLATGLAALAYLTGRPVAADELVTPPRSSLPALDEAALTREALDSSPSLAALSARVEEARAAEKAARGSLPGRPDLGLNLAFDITGQDIPLVSPNWTDTWDWDLVISLGASMDVYDSGAARARLEQAAARRAGAEAGLEELRRSMGLTVRRLVESARLAEAEFLEKSVARDFALEQARSATLSLEAELLNRSDERLARAAAIAAELDCLAAGYRLENALLELERLRGAPLF
jgi:outer membrane protein TolC